MRRIISVFFALSASACGPVPEPCIAFEPPHRINVNLTNHGVVALIDSKSSWDSSNALRAGQTKTIPLDMLFPADCQGTPQPPKQNEVAANHLLLYEFGDTKKNGRLLYGGLLANYQADVVRYQGSDFANSTLHGHSLFFVPGSQVRQDLGLVVNNPTGTEIFTSLDPWRPYKFAGFTLNIDVYDLDAGDIRMSVTGTLAN